MGIIGLDCVGLTSSKNQTIIPTIPEVFFHQGYISELGFFIPNIKIDDIIKITSCFAGIFTGEDCDIIADKIVGSRYILRKFDNPYSKGIVFNLIAEGNGLRLIQIETRHFLGISDLISGSYNVGKLGTLEKLAGYGMKDIEILFNERN